VSVSEYAAAAKRCVGTSEEVRNMVHWMMSGPVTELLRSEVQKLHNFTGEEGVERLASNVFSREGAAADELRSFVDWVQFHSTAGQVSFGVDKASLQNTICGMFMEEDAAARPDLRQQKDLAVLLFNYLSRYMVTVKLQVPGVDDVDGTIHSECYVNNVQLVEDQRARPSWISYSMLRAYTEQQLNRGRKPTKKVLKYSETPYTLLDERGVTEVYLKPNENAYMYELGEVFDGNKHGSHLHAVIKKANGDRAWLEKRSAWIAAEPTLMALANDPNYTPNDSGKRTNADIVTFLQDNSRHSDRSKPSEFTIYPAIRIHKPVKKGGELFISYDAGDHKQISYP
jgi:hypothetical protein